MSTARTAIIALLCAFVWASLVSVLSVPVAKAGCLQNADDCIKKGAKKIVKGVSGAAEDIGGAISDGFKAAGGEISETTKREFGNFTAEVKQQGSAAWKSMRHYLDMGLVPGVSQYFAWLEIQGNRQGWSKIPADLVDVLNQSQYYGDNGGVGNVVYTEGINTIHNQHITVGEKIFFVRSMDFNNPCNLLTLLHELEHVIQYRKQGGISSFVTKYLLNGGIEIIGTRSVNVHDAIGIEEQADAKAYRIVEEVWQQTSNSIGYNYQCDGILIHDSSAPEGAVGFGGEGDGEPSSPNANGETESHNTIESTPATEAAQAVQEALNRGEIDGAVARISEAEEMLGEALPDPLLKEVCRQGEIQGHAASVRPLCYRILETSLHHASVPSDHAAEAESFTRTLLAHLNQFQLPAQDITQRSMLDALLRPDAGLRINATIQRVWDDWLPYGPQTVRTDPATQKLSPFRVLVIRLIQGRELTLTTSEQHALYNLLTRSEPSENWRNSMNGIIGTINRESFQGAFQTGNSIIATAASAQPAAVDSSARSESGATTTTVADVELAPVLPSNGEITLITDFERFGTWKRGDEAWGTFQQSSEQATSGSLAGKFTYDFPAGADNNYVVFRSPLPIPGEPNALTLQVYGDGSTHFLNAWVEDANGQLWQFTFGRIHHQGWQEMVAPLDLSVGWPNQAVGNSNASAVTYPIRFYAFVLDGYASDKSFSGTVFVDDLAAVRYTN